MLVVVNSYNRTWRGIIRLAEKAATTLAAAAHTAGAEIRVADLHLLEIHAAGILYAPDYVINAGGIISVTREFQGDASEAQVIAEIEGIPARLTEIFERSRRENRPPGVIADQMARARLGRQPRKLVA